MRQCPGPEFGVERKAGIPPSRLLLNSNSHSLKGALMTQLKPSVFAVVFAIVSAILLSSQLAAQQTPVSATVPGGVPQLITFKGSWNADRNQRNAGLAGATFAIYREQSGGAPLWIETQNVEMDAQG